MQNSVVHSVACIVPIRSINSGWKATSLVALSLSLLSVARPALASETVEIPMSADRWTTTGAPWSLSSTWAKHAIELKPGNVRAAHPIRLGGASRALPFTAGTIEYDVAATSDMGAGFIFRRANKDNYEMFYLRPRPKCEEAPDCVQYAPETHGVLLWDMFPQYQGRLLCAKARVESCEARRLRQANEYLHQWRSRADVEDWASRRGQRRRRPDVARPGNLCQSYGHSRGCGRPASVIRKKTRRHRMTDTCAIGRSLPFSKLAADQAPTLADLPALTAHWTPLDAERSGLVNASRVYGRPRRRRTALWSGSRQD